MAASRRKFERGAIARKASENEPDDISDAASIDIDIDNDKGAPIRGPARAVARRERLSTIT